LPEWRVRLVVGPPGVRVAERGMWQPGEEWEVLRGMAVAAVRVRREGSRERRFVERPMIVVAGLETVTLVS
jgi:hypothetical protein